MSTISFFQRRRLLGLLSASAVVSLLPACSAVPAPGIALPKGGDPADIRLRWLQAAATAPSPHNLQPWRVVLMADGGLLLLADGSRLLPAADPFARQTLVSLGGFLELLAMAAGEDRHGTAVHLFPQGMADPGRPQDQPVARLDFMAGCGSPDPLFAAASRRRSNRRPYRTNHALAPAARAALLAAADVPGVHVGEVMSAVDKERIGRRASAAWEVEMRTPEVVLEELRLTRIGRREADAHRDGIAVTGPLPWLAARLGLFPRDRVPAPGSPLAERLLSSGREQAASAAGWIWLHTRDNTPTGQIAAGRAFVRLQLAAALHGVANQPMSQALEEYPAMREIRLGLLRDLGLDPRQDTVQMLVRVGYADPVPASRRRPLARFAEAA